jgi:cytoskeletal protein CcmA (bactofilin family)
VAPDAKTRDWRAEQGALKHSERTTARLVRQGALLYTRGIIVHDSQLMKRVIFVFLLLVPFVAGASEADSYIVASGTSVADNYVKVGNDIAIDGDVTGDVILAGADIVIRGHVGGDVLVVGNNIRVLGPVDGNIRAAGNDIEIANTVGKNVTVAGSAVTLTKDGVVNGTFSAAAVTLSVAGSVKHQVDAVVSEATLSGMVDGDLRIRAGQSEPAVRLTETAKVGGTFRYTAAHSAEVAEGAVISGPTIYNAKAVKNFAPFLRAFHIFQTSVKFFGIVLLGLILMGVARKFSDDVVTLMAQRPGRSSVFGFLVMVGGPIVILFFLLTVIGIPLALLLAAVYLIVFLLSSVMVSLRVGRWLVLLIGRRNPNLAKNISPTWVLVLGAFATLLVVDGLFGAYWVRDQPLLGLIGSLLRSFLAIWSIGALAQVVWARVRSSSNAV